MRLARPLVPGPLLGRGQQAATVAPAGRGGVHHHQLQEGHGQITEAADHRRHRPRARRVAQHHPGIVPTGGQQLVGAQVFAGHRRRAQRRQLGSTAPAPRSPPPKDRTPARLDDHAPLRRPRPRDARPGLSAAWALTACSSAAKSPTLPHKHFTPKAEIVIGCPPGPALPGSTRPSPRPACIGAAAELDAPRSSRWPTGSTVVVKNLASRHAAGHRDGQRRSGLRHRSDGPRQHHHRGPVHPPGQRHHHRHHLRPARHARRCVPAPTTKT